MNNVGSTTLLHPVFNNLEQVIIFRRVDYPSSTTIVITFLSVFILTHPSTFPVGGNRSALRKPTTFGKALTDSFHMQQENRTHDLIVKDIWSDNCDPYQPPPQALLYIGAGVNLERIPKFTPAPIKAPVKVVGPVPLDTETLGTKLNYATKAHSC